MLVPPTRRFQNQQPSISVRCIVRPLISTERNLSTLDAYALSVSEESAFLKRMKQPWMSEK